MKETKGVMMEAVKLNIGAGEVPIEGFTPIDRKLGLEGYPLDQYEDNSVSEILASHVLEHFPHAQALNVLKEWVRVLKPGGVLRIAVPDLEWIAKNYLAGNDVDVQRYLFGGQTDGNDFHQVAFDRELLTAAMQHAGLVDIEPWVSEVPTCASLEVSLNLKGMKPIQIPKLTIGCAMSVPRLGFQDNFFAWAQALQPLGILPVKYDGAFWGQCIERVMSEMVDSCDWILTVDYDSVFTREHVETLIRTAVMHPEVDALAPVQIRRMSGMPLCTVMGDDGKYVDRIEAEKFNLPLLKIHTAHFGCTLIKCEALKKLAHPWFKSEPNASGEWGEGRIDDDIYFWKRWAEAGNSLYLANRVVLGHIEAVVTWPGKDLTPIHQHPNEFWRQGPPENVWQ